MAKKLRTTKRKRNTKRKLRNTKRILGTKRYKGGGNIGENEKKETYKKLLKDANEALDGIKLILGRQTNTGVGYRDIMNFITQMKENIDQNTAEELKQKLVLVSEKIKTYTKLELPNIAKYKNAALQKAEEINAELLK